MQRCYFGEREVHLRIPQEDRCGWDIMSEGELVAHVREGGRDPVM